MTLVEITQDGKVLTTELSAAPEADLELGPDADLDAVAESLASAKQVAVRFPAFSDGRGYSIARRLRNQYGYRGRLLAVGDVLVDQVHLMARVGFDAFLLKEGQKPEKAAQSLARYQSVYQASADGQRPVWELRRRNKAA
ncbi:DUF934 domain-containing protein [Telmatospirillum sp. J64-1]|uniref:DUF934 domain-containing protein n=1 Tax=Telmatospirillum sp. J64-1 TaxID=2502183 RepID=UPI00115F17DE|nr:DUF934 domain-containing protein [Telmatospirillum sp. J64-1]